MKYSDETLMAFADGELDEKLRAEIESVLADDAQLARRVAAHRELRARLQGAYAPSLGEAVPQRLLDTLADTVATPAQAPSRKSNVVAFGEPLVRQTPKVWGVPQWSAIAASLIIGVGAGYLAFRSTDGALIAAKNGALVADAALARSLSQTLVGEQAGAGADGAGPKIGISYRSKAGDLCRSFSDAALAGIACRDANQWQIRMLTQAAPAAGNAGSYRTAASELPPAIRQAIDSDIDGEPLDAQAERDARARGWRAK